MKKSGMLIGAALLTLSVSVFYPYKGVCAMHGDEGGSEGMMEHHEGMHEGDSGSDEMMYHLNQMKEHMSAVMGKMASMIKEEAGKGKAEMYRLMDEACAQMSDINKMEESGEGTSEDMKTMEERKKRMDKMMGHMGSE